MSAPDDAARRSAALDASRSFIVEAPAGSGKTELLIQRYLLLLASVEAPEQVVAITFTRKAAAEMRQRVVDVLRSAADREAALPPHRALTRELAERALERSASRHWSLLEHHQRLRITTIDALNAGLAQQLPLAAGGIVGAGIVENAFALYRGAARRTLDGLAEDAAARGALKVLLGAADNSREQLEDWLASTLPQRDRWLRHLALGGDEDWSSRIEAAVEALRAERLESLRALAGAEAERALIALFEHLDAGARSAGLDAVWQRAAVLFLTRSGDWRRRFTRREGLPAEDMAGRERLALVLESFDQSAGLREALAAFADCPEQGPDHAERTRLEALQLVLLRLLAELRVLFSEQVSVDYTELALAAQTALGSVDAPSELLLALDRRIEHLLVDEFQDTSHMQWRLIELLTSGWEPGDGRSLFLVGDPMQSIYRFRDADLSLFLRAKQRGIGSVALNTIALADNHRSAPALVDWVNASFAHIFGPVDQVDTGRPGFRSAAARRGAASEQGVELHLLGGADAAAETARVAAIVERETRRDPGQSIGILVRSRTHLAGLRAALKARGLEAHATEIDSLGDTSLGQDLIGLTRALTHGGDRIAWLGVLRAPWCGLGWRDLHALASTEREAPVWQLLNDDMRLAALGADARARAVWLRERLATGFALRARFRFGRWVRACWHLLDGPACLGDASELEQAEAYFRELDAIAKDGDLDDPAALADRFMDPAMGSEVPAESGIEIMTIHRAKGLEFDTVVLMGLGRAPPAARSKLMLACDFFDAEGRPRLLLAAHGGTRDALHAFLRRWERGQEAAERARLLYVAATRARERLHLVGAVEAESGAPPAGSLLACLWPALDERARPEPEASPAAAPEWVELPLERLAFDADIPLPPLTGLADTEGADSEVPEFEWVSPASVQVGTVMHRELERLAAAIAHRPALQEQELALDVDRYRRELSLLGVAAADLPEAAERVATALARVWTDPRGRWILQARPEAWSELRLTVRGSRGLEHLKLDRSFVDEDGRRWIIDYKTGRHLGGNVEEFLAAEVERYREQLERYARAVAALDARPLRVGLYFPLMPAFRDWMPEAGRAR